MTIENANVTLFIVLPSIKCLDQNILSGHSEWQENSCHT